MNVNNLLKRVFLYGTLKTNERNHYLLMDSKNGFGRLAHKAVSREKLPLIVATQYNIPFLLNKPGYGVCVRGEIFEVDERMLSVLDKLEDVGNFYEREVMTFNTIEPNNGHSIEAFVYVLNKYPKGLLNLPMIAEYKNHNCQAYVPPTDRKGGSSKEVLWREY